MLVPVGSVVTSVTYNVPNHYTKGPGFKTLIEALKHAVAEKDSDVKKHVESSARLYPGQPLVPLPERITIHQRMVFAFPEGGGLDTVVETIHYDSLESAKRILARNGGGS